MGPQCHRYDFLVRFTEWTLLFSNFLTFYSSLGIDHKPPCFLCSHDLCLFLFLCFTLHDHMTKRSQHRIMIFYNFGVLLIRGRIPTFILFYFLHKPTTPKLPIYVDQQRPHLEEDTTRTRSMVVWKLPTVPRRTLLTPD